MRWYVVSASCRPILSVGREVMTVGGGQEDEGGEKEGTYRKLLFLEVLRSLLETRT